MSTTRQLPPSFEPDALSGAKANVRGAAGTLIGAVVAEAVKAGWRQLPLLEPGEADLVFEGPQGRRVVVEILLAGVVHLASLAQVDTIAGNLEQGNHEVRSVILTSDDVSDTIKSSANEIGVSIVADPDPTKLSTKFGDFLDRATVPNSDRHSR